MFVGLDLSDLSMDYSQLQSACLNNALLRGTTLKGAQFHDASLIGTDLSDCDLRDAIFDFAVMKVPTLTLTLTPILNPQS